MDSIITLILSAISLILIVYNFLLKRTLNNSRREEIQKVKEQIKESKDETSKTVNELNDLIDEYKKL